MWSLVHPNGMVVYITLQKKEIQIGRNPSSDLCLTSDQTISRHHAKITVYQNTKNSRNYSENSNTDNSICEITDQGSRYSTYVIRDTEIKLIPSQPFQLNPGDKIKFSSNKNIWTLNYTKIGIVSCGHDHDNKKKLVKAIEDIGGTVFNECNSKCTHYLSMCNRITPKFILAVIDGLPITDKKYWDYFLHSVKQNIKLPEVEDFIITNACLPEEFKDAPLYSTDDRRRIFDGYNFIFFSTKQCNNYGLIIKAAGGKSFLYHKFTFDTEDLLEPNMIIIEYYPNKQDQNLKLISDKEYYALQITLREKNRRMVRCVEILGAILFCSTKKYCNSIIKVHNRFWNDSPQKKRKTVQKTVEINEDQRKGALDHVRQKENQPVSEKIIDGQVNVPQKKLELRLELSRCDTPVSENRWVDVKASQKVRQKSQAMSTTDIKRTDINKNKKLNGETNQQNECGKSSSENVLKNPKEAVIKLSKDKKDIGTQNKTYRNKNKESDLANYSKAGSRKSTKATSKHSEKLSRAELPKLKNKNLNQEVNSVVQNHSDDESEKSSANTVSAVQKDSRNKISKDIEDEKLEKKLPSTQSRAEVRRKKRFEDILGVLDVSKKISSKNQNVDKSNNQDILDNTQSKKDSSQSGKGIKIISNVQVEIPNKNFSQAASDPKESNKKVEILNEKNLDESKESSESKEKLNRKRKLDEKETTQVPDKFIKILKPLEEEPIEIISLLNDSFPNNSQLLDHDYFETNKKLEDSTELSEIPSAHSPKCSSNNTKINNQVNSELEFPNGVITQIPEELVDDNRVSDAIDRTIISDQELIQEYENFEDDDVDLINPLITSTQNENIENDQQSSRMDFLEFQEHQDDCDISNADVHRNSDSSSADENLESAFLTTQDIRSLVRENSIKPNYKVDDCKTSFSNKLPGFFFQ
ncbi:nibrin-like isoform X2 [Cotesia glomerata]|uniref:nibrin-like isoform X2 n=1 Tax=Cotesia glomerata TaxID=32391 RepID=UPI001D02EC07|nr:nibrin-like isoform X2 [Cotesia glomerata]